MKKKTNKLRTLEKNRYSILTEDLEHCFVCGKEASDIHEIYAGRNRKISMQNGFCVPLCRTCHTLITLGKMNDERLKRICQEKFEETSNREEWLNLIGRSYL